MVAASSILIWEKACCGVGPSDRFPFFGDFVGWFFSLLFLPLVYITEVVGGNNLSRYLLGSALFAGVFVGIFFGWCMCDSRRASAEVPEREGASKHG